MKENNMSQSNRFSALHSLALTNHHQARALMNETMFGSVKEKFREICGAAGSHAKAMVQLRLFNRYAMIANHGQGVQIQFLLGYYFPDEQPTDSSTFGMYIYVNPKAAAYETISQAMIRFSESTKGSAREWYFWEASDGGWSGIGCDENLESVFAEEDHVKAISKRFEALLDDAATFRKQNPKLPWSARASDEDEA
jgi:hypothetical protein